MSSPILLGLQLPDEHIEIASYKIVFGEKAHRARPVGEIEEVRMHPVGETDFSESDSGIVDSESSVMRIWRERPSDLSSSA
jgi:hypothetical protein